MRSLLRKWGILMNRKFWIVLGHTFYSNVKTKSFIISTVIMALLVVIIFNLPTIIHLFDQKSVDKVGVLDRTGQVFSLYEQQTKEMKADYEVISYENEANAKEDVMNGKIKAYLLIDKVVNGAIVGNYKAKEITDQEFYGKVIQGLKQVQFRLTANSLNLTPEQAALLFQDVTLQQTALDPNAKTLEQVVQSSVLIYILLFGLYFSVLGYGSMVAMEVAKEKSSRVMEILVSSVPPVTQMFGKIIGISLVGLLQGAVFVGAGAISMAFGDKKVDLGGFVVDFSNFPASILIYAGLFFILGYLLYATIAAMLGSLVNNMEEIQTMMLPLTMVVVIAFMISIFGLSNPNALYVTISSYIPFFTPLVMFLRIGLTNPAWWEVLITMSLLIGTILISVFVAAKVYRGGVLMYGKASFTSILKAMHLQKEK